MHSMSFEDTTVEGAFWNVSVVHPPGRQFGGASDEKAREQAKLTRKQVLSSTRDEGYISLDKNSSTGTAVSKTLNTVTRSTEELALTNTPHCCSFVAEFSEVRYN